MISSHGTELFKEHVIQSGSELDKNFYQLKGLDTSLSMKQL